MASAVVGGWLAGIGFAALLLPTLTDLAQTGVEYFSSVSGDPEDIGWNGTGFIVGSTGYVLTNYHVIEGCSDLRGRLPGLTIPSFDVIGQDRVNDVAVLRPSVPLPAGPMLRPDHLGSLGEKVVVAGYPMQPELASTIHVTTGTISALAGPEDDVTMFQITAPVQHGNSGSPVFDDSGAVIGIVTSMFSEDYAREVIGATPQNINFAVRMSIAKTLLNVHDIAMERNQPTSTRSIESIAASARKFTVALECLE